MSSPAPNNHPNRESAQARRDKAWLNDQLCSAARDSDLKAAIDWLARGANPLWQDPGQSTAMHYAARSESTEFVRGLIELFPKEALHANGNGGRTPLMDAAGSSPAAVLALLPGSDPNAATEQGWNPLIFSIVHNQPKCVALLLPATDLKRRKPSDPNPLDFAIRGKSLEVIKMLLPHFDLLAHNKSGETPLMIACSVRACPGSFELLLPRSDPLARDPRGRSALHLACAAANFKATQALAALCGPSMLDQDGRTPLQYAASAGARDCVHALIPLIDPKALATDARRASEIALEHARPELAGELRALAEAHELRQSLPGQDTPPARARHSL